MRNVTLTYGKDGTGNLYNVENITHMVEQFGANSMDFITADGGFDFSTDYNNQESSSFALIMAEIASIMRLQRKDGSCIIKIYDVFNARSIQVIHFLKQHYKKVYFTKPMSSRPANSEKYIVCTGFKCDLESLYQFWEYYENGHVCEFLDLIETNYHIIHSIIKYNIYATIRQAMYIDDTLAIVDCHDEDKIKHLIQEGNTMSRNWCLKYVPHLL
jgi:hypothetical protein